MAEHPERPDIDKIKNTIERRANLIVDMLEDKAQHIVDTLDEPPPGTQEPDAATVRAMWTFSPFGDEEMAARAFWMLHDLSLQKAMQTIDQQGAQLTGDDRMKALRGAQQDAETAALSRVYPHRAALMLLGITTPERSVQLAERAARMVEQDRKRQPSTPEPQLSRQQDGLDISQLPHYAEGGIVTKPTLAVIGEAGPEMVVPLNDLDKLEQQANAQSSAVGGYYQGYYQQPDHPQPGDVIGWRSWLSKFAPADLQNNPEFLDIVTAGAHGESELDPTRKQPDGSGHGLFQFDTSPGALGEGLTDAQLLDPNYQAQQIVPLYAFYYNQAPKNLSGAEKAAWVAAHAERPAGWSDPSSQAYRNYKRGYNAVTGGRR